MNDYEEKSNFNDLVPSTNRKNTVGQGLFLGPKRESNLSNEMAALDSRNPTNCSPGFKKSQLDGGNVMLDNFNERGQPGKAQ